MSRHLSITLYLVYVCVLQKRAKKTATKNGKNLEDNDELVEEESNGEADRETFIDQATALHEKWVEDGTIGTNES